MARVLILGGTTEARRLAIALEARRSLQVISSLSGRVDEPLLPPGDVRIGGFGGADGLSDWLRENRIDALIDATHPFATSMSSTAEQVSTELGVPLLVLRRPGWVEQPGDQWLRVPTLDAAAQALTGLGIRVLLTTGRTDLAPFVPLDDHWFLIRSVDAPQSELPKHSEVLLARGPFRLPGEIALMTERKIDVLVTKDSGGKATSAKLAAARELKLPVVMVSRPPVSSEQSDVRVVSRIEDAVRWVFRVSSGNAAE
jgi:precorrin-6A/cobalt-precorrin-6A reductase